MPLIVAALIPVATVAATHAPAAKVQGITKGLLLLCGGHAGRAPMARPP